MNMKSKKVMKKTYVLMLSQSFPTKHPRSGSPTGFRKKFLSGEKRHTIRPNFPLWAKRIHEVQQGEAVISVRQWEARPYFSRQITIGCLTAESGTGIQKLTFQLDRDGCASFNFFDIDGKYPELKELAANDGLSVDDWKEWFRGYDFSQPMAVIQFGKFRY
jgi:hypothetical protein